MNSWNYNERDAANKYKKLSLTLFALGLLALALPAGSLYAQVPPPANDNFADARVVGSLPFTDTVDNRMATTEFESGERVCGVTGTSRTVWYVFTPTADVGVTADTTGSRFDGFDNPVLCLYRDTGSGLVGLDSLNDNGNFLARAGITYYIQAGSNLCCGGTLQVNLNESPPPANDDFANATRITALPFSDAARTAVASTETGEPTPSCATMPTATIWYAFTAETSGLVSAFVSGSFQTLLAAYTGSALTDLTEIRGAACNGDTPGCRGSGGLLAFQAEAGTTYYFQAGGLDSDARGLLFFYLIVTPPPFAFFYYYPYEPTIVDTVQFGDGSYDPGGFGIQSQSWTFDDGATATDCCPTHRYASDGDYTVELTVTTCDGRTGSTSQVVHVKTHDVAITKFLTPNAASSGQTRTITVGINSKRYAENVEVQLLRSRSGSYCYPYYGYECVGSLTQSVPVRSANRTTDFRFSYTFTSNDASIGKVSFRAVANIANALDALPGDNEAIAPPTKVTR